jgi:hypothetical protein
MSNNNRNITHLYTDDIYRILTTTEPEDYEFNNMMLVRNYFNINNINYNYNNYNNNYNNNNNDSRLLQQTMSNSLYDNVNKYKMVITDEAFQTIIPTIYRNLTQEDKLSNTVCCISLEDFNDDDDVLQLHCSHVFHKDAITHWLKKESSICPVCRFKYDDVEVENTDNNNNANNANNANNVNSDLSIDNTIEITTNEYNSSFYNILDFLNELQNDRNYNQQSMYPNYSI